MTFAQKVCLRVADFTSDDPGALALKRFKDVDLDKVWTKIQDIYLKKQPKDRDDLLNKIANLDAFHSVFAAMLEFFLIARDSNSVNPWGELLTILDVELSIEEVPMLHAPKFWLKIKAAQAEVQAHQKRAYDDLIDDWKNGEALEENKPAIPSLAKADPNAYMLARIVSCFPAVPDALESWRLSGPTSRRKHFLPSHIKLGDSNPLVKQALSSEKNLRKSFIWDMAKEAGEGSEKLKWCVAEIERLAKEGTKTVVKTADGTKDITYRSKFVVAVGIRFVRALLWCCLVQHFGEKHIVSVHDKASRVQELPKWQRYWNPQTEELDDKVCILIAGLKVIAHSVTLVEGHVLCGFDPPINNHDNVQLPKRQWRIGQMEDCILRYLTTVNPTRPNAAKLKSNPFSESKRTIESTIVARNKGKADFLQEMRKLSVTNLRVTAKAIVDLTKDDDEEEV